MFRKFKFEEPRYTVLDEVPYSTRFKLDTVGVVMDAATWRRLPLEERNVLCHLSVRSQGERDAYRGFLVMALHRAGVEPSFPEPLRVENERLAWENPARIPSLVVEASFRSGLPLRPEDWLRFDDMERYVLYRVAQENPEALAQVVAEFIRGGRKGPPTIDEPRLRRARPGA